ncbi:trehalose-6-phosphate synthase [Bradyrhizobium yuanmingense]|uniref:Trehalose-6-phosphate synthase n=1 Tax=Bradyrhizobium yuanmingense TaxID=108015 RepID=A0ABV4GLA2_9BRAD
MIVLSNFAGAAYELNTAEIVNPMTPTQSPKHCRQRWECH